jgi:AhpD family alkylhydroperoxidase
MGAVAASRPTLTAGALRRWLPPLARHALDLVSAYTVPGRVPPSVREAAMLGVTSVNRCEACEAVHARWSRHAGLDLDDLSPDEASAYAYGQEVAVAGPRAARPPVGMSPRHRRELAASAILMELANLAGNRFLAGGGRRRSLQVGDARTARLLDLGMRAADRAGLHRARSRIAGRARGDVLELGVGTGSNLGAYPADITIHGIDVSAPALSIAAVRARGLERRVLLTVADATALPFSDASFDTVVATFVLCSVGDVDGTLREARRVLRPGGTIRLLEHAEADHPVIAGFQRRSAPAWARMSGGCRLDHDVGSAVRKAGLTVVAERRRVAGILVEIVAAA